MAGTILADDIQHSTAGSVGTEYVVNGSAKMWANMDGSLSTPAFRDGLNNSSITDHATGQFTVSFSTSMSNNDYSVPSTGSRSDSVGAVAMSITPRLLTTSNFIFTCEYNNGSTWDYSNIFLSTFGDLA